MQTTQLTTLLSTQTTKVMSTAYTTVKDYQTTSTG